MDSEKYPLFYGAGILSKSGASELIPNYIKSLTPENREKFRLESIAAIKESLEERRKIDESYRSQGVQSYTEDMLLANIMDALTKDTRKDKKTTKP